MARINLLPWRTELRKQRQKEFFSITAAAMLSAAAVFCLVHYCIGSMIDYQTQRNKYLESEIALLDKKIKEIEELETKKKRLIAKMEVISVTCFPAVDSNRRYFTVVIGLFCGPDACIFKVNIFIGHVWI